MSYSLNKLVLEKKTRPLPSSAAIELSEQIKEGVQGVQGRVLSQVVKDLDVLTKMVEEDRQTNYIVYSEILKHLQDIGSQLPSAFLKKIWFPITLAVLIAVILAWVGLK